jgi:hypothetical protein
MKKKSEKPTHNLKHAAPGKAAQQARDKAGWETVRERGVGRAHQPSLPLIPFNN